jgi:hypothetical protein
MSYIRCLSNPERLYIYGSFTKRKGRMDAYISLGTDHGRRMPIDTFNGLLKKWWKDGDLTDVDEVVRFRNATLTVTKDWRWAMNYPGWDKPAILWEVTLHYLCSTNNFRWAKNRRG